MMTRCARCAVAAFALMTCLTASAQENARATASFAELDRDVREFLGRELGAHLADVRDLQTPQAQVLGVPTTGEFSWGTFMRALATYSELSGERSLAGRNLPATIGKIGLIESRAGGKAFSQLYGGLALQHFGNELSKNALWQSLSPEEQQAWRALLDPARFYDREHH